MEDEWKIVSSTDGEIKSIILTTLGKRAYGGYDTYLGLCDAFGKEKVTAIHITLELELTDTNIMKLLFENMGESRYNLFFSNSANQSFFNTYKTHEVNEILQNDTAGLRLIEQQLETHIKEHTIEKFEESTPYPLNKPDIQISLTLSTDTIERGEMQGWVQDHFISLQKENTPNQYKIAYSQNNNKQRLAALRMTEKFRSIQVLPLPVEFLEGGNFLASKNFIIVGRSILEKNYNLSQHKPDCSDFDKYQSDLEKLIKDTFNANHVIWTGFKTPIVLPGESPPRDGTKQEKKYQPLFHVDLYLAPSGITKIDSGKECNLIFIGNIDTKYYNQLEIAKYKRAEVITQLNKLIKDAENDFHDYYNKWKLKNPSDNSLLPFTFKQIPVLVDFEETNNDVENKRSFLNVHIEITKKLCNVYLPQFENTNGTDYATALKDACRIYKNEGLDTIVVEPYVKQRNGALHCYSKVMYRQ
jgi:hypothetical protein